MGYIEKHPQEAQRLIGLNYDQLKQLIKQAIALHMQAQSEAELRKTRIIKKGGGRKTKLYDGRTNIIKTNGFKTPLSIGVLVISWGSKSHLITSP
ncbi:MAG: hypothetical protein AAGG00_20920, partial [Cyanobacteria bacterium P01_H01_bin.150]